VTGRPGRRRRKLLDDLKKRRGYSHLKQEGLDRTMWTALFERGFGPVVRQTTKLMNECAEAHNISVKMTITVSQMVKQSQAVLWAVSSEI
jgi:hypothetical protein